jgi:acyl carrier protein
MNPSRTDILQGLQAAFGEVLPEAKRELRVTDDLLDLGIGSIAALEMAVALEDRYGVNLPEEKLAELRTVGDFVDLVESLVTIGSELPDKGSPDKGSPDKGSPDQGP